MIIMIIIIVIIMITITIIMMIVFISQGYHSQIQDMIFAVALRFKDYTFHALGHRVDYCSSRQSFLNDERDFHIHSD